MRSFDKKVLAGFAVTTLALATVAPLAEASGYRTNNSDYYRGPVAIHRSYYPARGYYYQRSSSVGPALAGFFGGLLLGAVLTNHSNQVVYRDPYSDQAYYSRQEFIDHCNAAYHPRRILIVRYSSAGAYYDDCRNRGYYDDGYRTYDRDEGVYRGYHGDGDDDNGYYRSDRYYRNDGGYRNDRYYRNDDRREGGDGDDDD